MIDVQLTIRGLTHSEISGEREAFLQSALGRRIWLQPASRLLDELRVEAFVGTKQVGCVASEDLSLFWQAMDAVKNGSGCDMLQGEIVKVEDYMLVARISVPLLEKPRVEAVELTNWEYSGPLMYKTREEVKLEFLTARLSEDLSAMEEDEVLELLDAFCRLIVHDLSRDAQTFRKSLRKRLGDCESKELRRASLRVEELSQRMGGDTMMEKMGQWLKNELTETDEALQMPARKYDLGRIMAEAKKLPKNLFELWHRDTAQMARVLYGFRAKREDVRRVLSCLVWIELREREYGMRYGGEKEWLNIDEMVMYCKQCVSWEDARPIVELMRNHLMQLGCLTGKELEKISSIEQEFLNRNKPVLTHKDVPLTASDKEIKAALESLLKEKDDEGKLLFKNKKQWWAVYRVLSTFCQYPKQMKSFKTKITDMEIDYDGNPNVITYVSLADAPKSVPQMVSCLPSTWNTLQDISENYKQQYDVAEYLMQKLGIKS